MNLIVLGTNVLPTNSHVTMVLASTITSSVIVTEIVQTVPMKQNVVSVKLYRFYLKFQLCRRVKMFLIGKDSEKNRNLKEINRIVFSSNYFTFEIFV